MLNTGSQISNFHGLNYSKIGSETKKPAWLIGSFFNEPMLKRNEITRIINYSLNCTTLRQMSDLNMSFENFFEWKHIHMTSRRLRDKEARRERITTENFVIEFE